MKRVIENIFILFHAVLLFAIIYSMVSAPSAPTTTYRIESTPYNATCGVSNTD